MQNVASTYSGPHHVRLNRNAQNLGLSAHFNHVLALCQGEIIVIAAGDDISLPSRVQDTVAAFARHPEVMAVSFEDISIDHWGVSCDDKVSSMQEQIIDLDTFLAVGPRAQSCLGLSGASRAFRRAVYEQFGDLRPGCPAEDSPYLLRALCMGDLLVCEWPGILYRRHEAQMSSANGIMRKSAERFLDQFNSDVKLAATCGLVSKKQAHRIARFGKNFATYLCLRQSMISQSKATFRLVTRVLGSSAFTLREKAGLLKAFFLRRSL